MGKLRHRDFRWLAADYTAKKRQDSFPVTSVLFCLPEARWSKVMDDLPRIYCVMVEITSYCRGGKKEVKKERKRGK